MKYTLFYIDEDVREFHSLKRKIADDEIIIKPGFSSGITLEALIPILEEKDFDFLIVDSNLNEKSACGFNGEDVLLYFTKKFPHFPVMLFTNYDDQAVDEMENFDINKIYSKKSLIDGEAKQVFIKKIKRMVNEYREKNELAEKKLIQLTKKKKSGKPLSANEEGEAVKLDTFLDEVLDGESLQIPDQIKGSNEEKIDLLLQKTDDLISKLKKYERI